MEPASAPPAEVMGAQEESEVSGKERHRKSSSGKVSVDSENPHGARRSRRMTPEEKRAEIRYGCSTSRYRDCEYRDHLQRQLAGSFYWSGCFLKDMWFWICNWHPLIGMFLSHPIHPWGKLERVFAFLASLAFNLLLTALFVKAVGESEGGLKGWVLFLLVTLPVIIFEIAWYWLSVSDVFCQGGRCHACVYFVRGCKYVCAACVILFATIVLLVSFLWLSRGELKKVGEPFGLSRLWSYLIWFPIWFFMPCLGFWHAWYLESRAAKANNHLSNIE